MVQLWDQHFDELTNRVLIGLLQLRSEVFVLEQDCVYLDIDGRDQEPGTRHIWLQDGPEIIACLRLLQDDQAQRIGRVVTAQAHRSKGYSAQLIEHTLTHSTGPWVLSAQAQLEHWYQRFGFECCGPGYLEDGLPHVPMHRGIPQALS
ncbi:MAG: GNAT family N-acetyltransferase [Pseudomonadales bacterium]